ncbi:MAG: stage IV sporulation protein A, partial [Eubacteriales bacterium]|nr:stage IV sporulation protein A [Eubacteriales bacterium]
MDRYDIYQQIAERTQGDIYIGVVGPVRTGKSTFIKRFMDLLVIPNIENEYNRERAKDELPQSATGRSIMTTEPKFVPNEAIRIVIGDNVEMRVRLVDCVGYLVKGALGYIENNAPRMVSTPWFDYQVPFQEAAEIGTRKVIKEHSTIGLVVTSDGSVCEIGRDEYVEAEERVIHELNQIHKPYVILLNSRQPDSPETQALRASIEEKYGVPAISVDAAQMEISDVNAILERILFEFPVSQIGINFPKWVDALNEDSPLKVDLMSAIKETFKGVRNIREARNTIGNLNAFEFIENARIDKISLGNGNVAVELGAPQGLFYRTMSDVTGFDITDDFKLASILMDMSRVKKDYDKIEVALNDVRQKGYGMVAPDIKELTLEEP